jgi:hypothetical protein
MTEKRPTFDCVFAIFRLGGGINTTELADGNIHQEHIEGEYLVHMDEQGKYWVLLFEDVETADRVRNDYYVTTWDNSAEVKPTLARSVDDHQNIRLYRYDGEWEDITRSDYMARLLN